MTEIKLVLDYQISFEEVIGIQRKIRDCYVCNEFMIKIMQCRVITTTCLGKRHMSRIMRKQTFYICENKDADQLRGNREADQRLCFRYTDSTIPLLPKSEISSL